MNFFGIILITLVGAFFIYELVTLIRDIRLRKKKKVENKSSNNKIEDKKIRKGE